MKYIALYLVIALLLPVAAAGKESWYTKTVAVFADAGYADESSFLPAATATRGEFVELTLRLLGGTVRMPFADPVFDDIGLQSPFFATFQEGARARWVLGVGSCAGQHPCLAAPLATVNRAEAAALIVRAFGLLPTGDAPVFADAPDGEWYSTFIRTAAGRCVLQGDAGKNRVRPGDTMNHAEMLSMLLRALERRTYPDCSREISVTLPPARTGLVMVQDRTSASSSASSLSSSIPSSAASASSIASVSSSSASSVSSSASSSLSSANVSTASSTAPLASSSAASSTSPDPRSAELIMHFQEFMADYSALLTQARSAEGDVAAQLLTVLRAQIDLLNQLFPFVDLGRQRTLTTAEWSSVSSLESRIETGFAQPPQ